MIEKFEATEVYCPDCDGDYKLAWSEDEEEMFVVCDCGEAEEVDDFLGRVRDEYEDGKNEDGGPRGYQ